MKRTANQSEMKTKARQIPFCRYRAFCLYAREEIGFPLRIGAGLFTAGSISVLCALPFSLWAGGLYPLLLGKAGLPTVILSVSFGALLLWILFLLPGAAGLYAMALAAVRGKEENDKSFLLFYLSEPHYRAVITAPVRRLFLFFAAAIVAVWTFPLCCGSFFLFTGWLFFAFFTMFFFFRLTLSRYFMLPLFLSGNALSVRAARKLSRRIYRKKRRQIVSLFLSELPRFFLILLSCGILSVRYLPVFFLEHASFAVHFCAEACRAE